MAGGRPNRRQRDEIYSECGRQRQLLGIVTGRRQPAARRDRSFPPSLLSQLSGGQMPASLGIVARPL